ncbi:DEAD/DEAH box helicase [Adlercreutzia aquisgranensis]|uniref:DEAD/DEAH box helicase n=1 Tax=Adlercreutzia aquisgranensis TaxID=2941323 RepID=UPI00203E1787|nr:DEAD/DEAH box helicase [Adlercreutzia aquisgranensis]
MAKDEQPNEPLEATPVELIPGTDVDPWEPGSLGWLLPWAETGEGDLMTADQALETFLTWVEARGIQPWPHQEDALVDLAAGDHVVLGTPTGSGKSLVAMGLCFIAMATGKRAYYTAPIKALVSEKFFAMVEVMGKDNVGMLTGDASINPDAPIVCCTAEILANIALAEGEDARADCVVMDEFHYYGEPDRGWAWQVPLLILKKAQFLLMSATLGDMSAIAGALQERTGRSVDLVLDAPRPVPLSFEYATTFLEATVELALRAGEEPLYVVHFSQDEAFGSAQKLSNFGIATKEQREGIKKVMRGTRFTTPFGKALQRLLLAGVGVHHAGMLPRYRLLVEKLAQKGLLSVICGTDTLGVGINVPIHTVVFTSLAKFDGVKQRRLRAREFHQIAGRAGRSGFDTEGVVIAEAPDHEIANLKAVEKAGGDPKKLRKVKKKQPPEGFVSWSEKTFERLVEAQPETLVPRMKMTHGMVLGVVGRGGDARANVQELIDESAQTPEEKAALSQRADEIFKTLVDTDVVVIGEDEAGNPDYRLTVELPEDFALDQPLSPFLLSALALFSPDEPNYALDVISLVEATLEDPRQVLRAQQRKARDRAMAQMKADGVDYEERLERLREVTYPRPLEDELDAAFELYCKEVPWARDFQLMPKSVLRDMVETAADFKTYVNTYGIARSEGTLLRYLSDAYRVLEKTVPPAARDEQLEEIVDWLGLLVRTTDSSLVDEWARAGQLPEADVAGFGAEDAVVRDRHGMELMVRNALFTRVKLIAADKADALGALDEDWGYGARKWGQVLDDFYDVHADARIDADARSKQYVLLDTAREEADHAWHVRQIVLDTEGDCDFCIDADVDLDASQEEGEVVFANYRAGFADELGE